jgi:hypothetical protein
MTQARRAVALPANLDRAIEGAGSQADPSQPEGGQGRRSQLPLRAQRAAGPCR